MKTSLTYSGTSSSRLLIQLMAAHLIGTIFAYTVYINLSSLGDGYAPEDFGGFDQDFSSTVLVHSIYAFLGVFLPGFLPPLLLGQVVAIVTWHAFRDVYTRINPKLFWACNLLPHFLVWSGSSSKEQMVIICGIVVIDFAVTRFFSSNRLSIASLAIVFLSLCFIWFVRPNYFLIYFAVFATSLLAPSLYKTIINRLSIGVWLFAFILAISGLIFFVSFNSKFINEDVVGFMKVIENSFLDYVESRSNRTNIQWNDISDFMYNSLWGIPQGIIGPTLLEVISKPIFLPVFLEGLVNLYILCFLFFRLFKIACTAPMLRVLILPYLFVAFVIVFVSYPYLIFNPGSGLRYKQSMHPILIFYPLLILAYASAFNLVKASSKTVSDDV